MVHTILFDAEVSVVFLAMITVLVFAHELGHYLFARLFGMGAEEFSIGIGHPLGTYYRRRYAIPLTADQADAWERGDLEIPMPEGIPKALEAHSEPGELIRGPEGPYLSEVTAFTVRLFPIGGFVRIRGMTPEAQGKETQVPGGFYSKPPWQRLVVLFSVLAGLAILVPYLMVVGREGLSHKPIVAMIDPEGPGKKAGLLEGDRITSIDGQTITDFFQVIVAVRSHPGQPLRFTVDRAGQSREFTVTPIKDKEPTTVIGPDLTPTSQRAVQGKFGGQSARVYLPLPFGAAAREACLVPILTVSSLLEGFVHPAQLKDQVGGPVSIVRVTAEATNDGLGQVVRTAGVLSVSLGIFNLLPIFPLDGGQMLVSLAELLRRGRRLSMKAQGVVATMGFSAIVMLVISVLYIDLQRLHNDNAKAPPPSAVK